MNKVTQGTVLCVVSIRQICRLTGVRFGTVRKF